MRLLVNSLPALHIAYLVGSVDVGNIPQRQLYLHRPLDKELKGRQHLYGKSRQICFAKVLELRFEGLFVVLQQYQVLTIFVLHALVECDNAGVTLPEGLVQEQLATNFLQPFCSYPLDKQQETNIVFDSHHKLVMVEFSCDQHEKVAHDGPSLNN